MAKLGYKNGIASVILRIKILDSTSTSGAGKTGLTSSSSGLIISTIADVEAAATVYAQSVSNIETITTLGTFVAPTASKCRFKEVDATNHPGIYEIQIADARWAVSNARSVIVSVSGVSGIAQVDAEIQLEPGAADVIRWNSTAVPTPDTAGYPKVTIKDGTGTGEIDTASGKVLLQDAAITAAVIATGAIDADAIADGAIDAGAIADGAITAAKVASDVIDADALATDAVNEIVAALTAAVADVADVWNYPTASATVSGSLGKLLVDNLNGTISSILARLPTVLVSGRIDASVGAMAADVLTAAAVAADAIGSSELATSAVTEIVDALLSAMASSTGTAAAGAAGTITLAASAVATTDYYINQWIWIRSGTGAGQSRRIKSYTSGRVATVDANWATNPSTDSVYYIFPSGRVDLGTVLGTSMSALVSGRVDSSVGAYQSGLVPLQPTTVGRTLDVSAGGEAGIDLANVGSPTTVLNLTGLTIKTATDVEADTSNIQTRIPAALSADGYMMSDVKAIGASQEAAVFQALALADGVGGAAIPGTLTTTQTSTDLSETTVGAWYQRTLVMLTGPNKFAAVKINAYNGAGLITHDPFANPNVNGNTFIIA